MTSSPVDLSRYDRITLTGVGAVGYHGVLEKEHRVGQPFFVDLVLYADLSAAGRSDDVTDTVHYGEVAQSVRDIIVGPPLQLIEALAQRLADALLAKYSRIQALHVTVHKPHAPLEVTFSDVAITVYRTRAQALDG